MISAFLHLTEKYFSVGRLRSKTARMQGCTSSIILPEAFFVLIQTSRIQSKRVL